MDYIGYKHNKQIGVAPAIVTAAVKVLPAVLPALSTWVSGWFPAGISGKEQRIIDNAKSSLGVQTSEKRLLGVVGLSNQLIVPDVIARDLFIWYRKNYPNDYQTLSYQTKLDWNNYMDQFPQIKPDRGGWQDRVVQWTQEAKFNESELNYNKQSTTTNTLFSNTGSSSNILLYGALGLGAILLIKKKKK
jgi:hypothetical protein